MIVAQLALVVEEDDRALTSEPDDIEHLIAVRRVGATVVATVVAI